MSKKVLGALLAIVMVLSVLSVTAFAAGATSYEEDASLYHQTWALTDPVNVSGNQYTVNVILTTDYFTGPISFKLNGADTVDGVEVGSGYYAGSYKSFSPAGLVLITPNTSATVVAQKMTNAVVAVVTYTSASNATPTIVNDPKTAANPSGSLIAARCDAETVNASNLILGQTAEVLGAGEAPVVVAADLQPAASGVVVDTSKKFAGAYDGVIYGIPRADGGASKITTGDFYKDYVTATNGGSLTVVKSIYSARGSSWGTGTEIEVHSADGSLSKKYVVVLFGDVDGNGTVDTSDLGLVLSESKASSLPDIKKLAANCYIKIRANVAQGLYNVDTLDLGVVLAQTKSYTELDFNAIGAKHAQYNEYYQ